MDERTAHLTTSPEGQQLLAELGPYREADAVQTTARLRAKGFAPDLVAAVMTQSRLRTRAAEKFGDAAAQLVFTPDALEQATRELVAQRHAARFVDAGFSHVIDGGCGIGSDSLRFAAAGLTVTAVEADAATAQLARFNLSGFSNARVVEGAIEDVVDQGAVSLWPACPNHESTAWWFDPARRLSGVTDAQGRTKRTFSLEALSPSWELISSVAQRAAGAGAKLSPSFAHADIPAGCEAEFVSYAGDVVECTLWWGRAVHTVGRTATVIRPASASHPEPGVWHVTEADAAGADDEPLGPNDLGEYFYEADKALTRSGLVGAMLNRAQAREFTPGFGYASSDRLVDVTGLGRVYRVVDALPVKEKTLRSYLRERGVGRVTIKKRDVTLDADALRRSLKLKGSGELTLVLVELAGVRTALVVERL